jgi:hypothetical protein
VMITYLIVVCRVGSKTAEIPPKTTSALIYFHQEWLSLHTVGMSQYRHILF